MDHEERMFLNAVTLDQTKGLLSKGYRLVLLRTKDIEVDPKMFLLLRDETNTRELVVINPDSNMSPVAMDMTELAEWLGMYGQLGEIQIPLIQNEYLDVLKSSAAILFQKRNALEKNILDESKASNI